MDPTLTETALRALESELPIGEPVIVYRASPEPWTRGLFLQYLRTHSHNIISQPEGISVPTPDGAWLHLPKKLP